MNTSKMFTLNVSDFLKALVMAVLSGAVLPVAVMLQTPGFNILQANWQAVGSIALTGALTGFVGYLVKNFFSDSSGKVLGAIG